MGKKYKKIEDKGETESIKIKTPVENTSRQKKTDVGLPCGNEALGMRHTEQRGIDNFRGKEKEEGRRREEKKTPKRQKARRTSFFFSTSALSSFPFFFF